MLDSLQSLLAVVIIALAAFGIGRPILRALAWPDEDLAGITVWSLGFGLLAAGMGFLALAAGGWLKTTVVIVFSLGSVLWALVELACVAAGFRRSNGTRPNQRTGWISWECKREAVLAATVGAVVLVPTSLRSLAPPVDPEVLSRSLAGPKEILLSQGGLLLPPGPPNLSQMWSLWALALDGPVAANVLHWGLGILAMLSTVLLARPLVGRTLSWIAGAAVWLVPGVQQELGVPLEGLPLVFVTALGLAAAQRMVHEFDQGRAAIAAGVMAGAAVAIDPAGLGFALALLLATAQAAWRHRSAGADQRGQLVWMSLAMLAFALPWVAVGAIGPADTGRSMTLAALGPAFAIALGGMVFVRRLRGLSWLLTVLVIYAVGAVLLGLGGAAWAPLVPIGGVLAAWTWFEIGRLPVGLKAGVLGLVSIALVFDLAYLYRSTAPYLGVALGRVSREEYLLEHEGSFRAAALLSAISGPGQTLLLEDAKGFYFSCATRTVDPALRQAGAASRERVILEEGRKAGASYVLLAEPVSTTSDATTAFDSTAMLAARLPMESDLLDRGAKVMPILEYRFADDNNRCIRYRLWKLQGPQARSGTQPPVASADGGRRVGQLPRPASR